MQRQEVVSSNMKSIGYDEKQMLLEVEFSPGSVYQYECVPKEMYEELMRASSKGGFFARMIKKQFVYKQMS